MHVFRGKVRVEEIGVGDSAIAASKSLLLSAEQAVRIVVPGKQIEMIKASEEGFCRSLPPLKPFSIFSTGVGLDRGASDPHWEITKISTNASFKPQHAVVAVPDANYMPDDRDKARWISNSMAKDDMPRMPLDTSYAFRFDRFRSFLGPHSRSRFC